MKKHTISCKALPVVFAGLLLLQIQCERFVEVDDPTNQISQTTVFKDKATAFAALADIYAGLRDSSVLDGTISGSHFLTACYTDDLSTVSNQQTGFRTFYDLTLQSSTSTIDYLWISAYKNIYAANNIIEGIAKSTAYLDEATRNTLTGEALAIRALLHLYLTGLFGQIPYVESTDYRINQSIPKNTQVEIMDRIKRDLQQAENLLPDSNTATDKTRLGRSAVRLLLARVFLYDQKYNDARTYANLVIQNPEYHIEQDPEKVFLKESSGTLWQFAPVEPGANTIEGQTYIIMDTPPPYAFLTQDLLNSFEPGDLRRTKWTKSITAGAVTFTFPYKYREFSKTPESVEYAVLLRIEEAYLIAAEAENSLGNTTGALQKLTPVRARAGLSTPASASQTVIRQMITEERRHEFFTEGSHRFLDLKRWGMLDQTLSLLKPQWQHYMQNWPLPRRELLVNPNLNPQNDGY